MDYIKLGSRLRRERQRLNLTQEKLAENINVSHAYIGQIERGERNLSLDTLTKLANYMGVPIDYLLHDSIETNHEYFSNRIKQLLITRSPDEQQMLLDMVELMCQHLDKIFPKKMDNKG